MRNVLRSLWLEKLLPGLASSQAFAMQTPTVETPRVHRGLATKFLQPREKLPRIQRRDRGQKGDR